MNYAYLSQISINENTQAPIYQQLRDAFRQVITAGIVSPGNKLPSSRSLSDYFKIHRQTVVAAMEELAAEGWIVSKGRSGLYVNEKLPFVKPIAISKAVKTYPAQPAFTYRATTWQLPATLPYIIGFNDGYPDTRIAPLKELAKAYNQTLHEISLHKHQTKRQPQQGSLLLRTELKELMQLYRGLHVTAGNIMITQGSQMSIFLVSSLLLNKGDHVIVTSPNYQTSNYCFRRFGANLLKVGIDKDGMLTDEVKKFCQNKKIRMLYITSHHHHPTTVTLSIERRLALLQLAEQYGFIILEDDYDYDFHYQNRPLMPIASNDSMGHVIYIGSFTKTLSHNFRTGYIIAPEPLIKDLLSFRRIIDRQGDPSLETAIGILLRDGVIRTHIKKALNLYRARRDYAFGLLSELEGYIQCELPSGGLAFWALFDQKISLSKLSAYCISKKIYFPDGSFYNYKNPKQNGCRLGFASMNTKEMNNAFDVMKKGIQLQLK